MHMKISTLLRLESPDNKNILINVIASFLVRGAGMFIGIFSLPLYLHYFKDNQVLGVWFTMLSVLSWILNFDLGVGNGLRNSLTVAIAKKDFMKAKELISSAYVIIFSVVVILLVFIFLFVSYVPWNSFFNVDSSVLASAVLEKGVLIVLSGILLSFVSRLIFPVLYALQKSAIPNSLSLISNFLIICFLWLYVPAGDIQEDFIVLAYVHACAINVPIIAVTILVFATTLRKSVPSFAFYCKRCAKEVMSIGIVFFLLQVFYMIIASTNGFFISFLWSPDNVVDYQIYTKVFSISSSLFALAMIPMWSAVTKAFAEKRYAWIIKIHRYLAMLALGIAVLQIAIVPFMQILVDIWLGADVIVVNYYYASLFAMLSVVMIWIGLESAFANGLGVLKPQFYLMLFAFLLKIVLTIVLARYAPWPVVIAITIAGLLPYCIANPMYIRKKLIQLQ